MSPWLSFYPPGINHGDTENNTEYHRDCMNCLPLNYLNYFFMRILSLLLFLLLSISTMAQKTQKPPLHARNWMAITGKPLSANAGAMIFGKGGNAVDAAAAMLAAGCPLWDTLRCGGETQALIYNPHTKKVIGLNALGVAPSGATPAYY